MTAVKPRPRCNLSTNPEQLFAAGWSACFITGMGLVASKMNVTLPADVAVDAEIDLCNSGNVYFLRARLNVSLPGLEHEVAKAIVDAKHNENDPPRETGPKLAGKSKVLRCSQLLS
jgi:Ohr subfamily peroxiredoxin